MKIDLVKGIISGLESWKQLTDTLERVLVGNIAATVPWLAPVIPAWMAYHNMVTVLHFWPPIALIGGLTVEGLGIATVNTAVKFWQHNRERIAQRQSRIKGKKKDNKPQIQGLAPFQMAVGMASFYLIVVLLVNVALDDADIVQRGAKLMLSLLAPVGAMTIALNAEFSNLLNKAEQKRKERKVSREKNVSGKLSETFQEDKKVLETSPKFDDWRKVPPSERLKMANMSEAEIKEEYHLSDKNASNWFKGLRRDKGKAGEIARFRDAQANAAKASDGAVHE